MKKLLMISRPFLGESLFATPCFELLSKDYEITLLLYPNSIPLFKQYKFIKNILPSCNTAHAQAKLPDETIKEIKRIFVADEDNYYAYINDEDVKFLSNHPELNYIKKYPVLHDTEIKVLRKENVGEHCISRSRKYILKLQLMSLEDTDKFDCMVRIPEYTPLPSNNDIIVYQGSRETLRKLSTSIIQKFINKIPNAIFLVTQETATELNMINCGIKHILISPYIDENLEKIVDLFKSKPKVVIGPDSGLTQLALGYKIPLIWLESRIPIESVIDKQYKDIYEVYRRCNPTCDQSCMARKTDMSKNKLSYGMFDAQGYVRSLELKCFKERKASCLEYMDYEIDDIIKLLDT